jgi:hypothetical protein
VIGIVPAQLQGFLRAELVWNRSLDRGNPHPGAIGSDFNRLGVDFWAEVYALEARNERRRELLQELIDWRNAIAHQDFAPVAPRGTPTLHLSSARVETCGWRACGLFRSSNVQLPACVARCRALVIHFCWRRAMPETRFGRGDQVKFSFGTRSVRGVVTEDRGPIGVGGRRLYVVEFRPEPQSQSTSHIELPADQLQRVQRAPLMKSASPR